MIILRLPAAVTRELAQIRNNAIRDCDNELVAEINALPASSVLRAEWIEGYHQRYRNGGERSPLAPGRCPVGK
ncbi:MAG: hypothetical protein MN733_32555 [Nitrososphaera sp.]|nr:hypothetical protein [Nitrososphaera sp.]